MPLELPEDGFDRGWGRHDTIVLGDAQGDTHDGGHQDADEQRTRDILDQHGSGDQDAEDAQQYGGIVEVAHGDERRIRRTYDTGTLQTNEGDEESDARTDGTSQNQRDGVDDVAAQTRDGEQDEDETLDEYGRQRKLPAVAHGQYHGEGEEGIQTHARSQCEGQLGVEGHHDGAHNGRDTGSGKHGTFVHAGNREDVWIHGQDIGHRQKGCDTADDFLADGHCGGIKSQKTK